MQHAVLLFKTKLQQSIRMGLTIFEMSIWGEIKSGIQSEIMFYSSACVFL